MKFVMLWLTLSKSGQVKPGFLKQAYWNGSIWTQVNITPGSTDMEKSMNIMDWFQEIIGCGTGKLKKSKSFIDKTLKLDIVDWLIWCLTLILSQWVLLQFGECFPKLVFKEMESENIPKRERIYPTESTPWALACWSGLRQCVRYFLLSLLCVGWIQ